MNWLDIVLLLILAASVIRSFRTGLTRSIIRLVSVVLAILLGAWFYRTAAAYLQPYVSSQTVANLGGFLMVFCGVLLLGGIVSGVVGRFLRVTGLSIVDHVLGAGFGLLRGTLVAVALIMGIMAFSKDGRPPQSVTESRLAPYVSQAARVFAAMAPHDLKEGFRKTYSQAKEVWSHTLRSGIHTVTKTEGK
jgi:membrane protein required for colicin V production